MAAFFQRNVRAVFLPLLISLISLWALPWLPAGALAGEAVPLVADPVIEARMTALSKELRCLVCQGQSIAESDSDFAKDVRKVMRTLMEQGRSDQEIMDFLVQRYGDFILFRPPMKGTTALLWVGPFLLLLLAAGILVRTLRRRRLAAAAETLSPEEVRRAEALLAGKDGEVDAGTGGATRHERARSDEEDKA